MPPGTEPAATDAAGTAPALRGVFVFALSLTKVQGIEPLHQGHKIGDSGVLTRKVPILASDFFTKRMRHNHGDT